MYWTRGRTIGRGSSATVSTATSHRSGDIFAVKSAELSRSESLQREQKILSTLSSLHVVSYVGYDITRENNSLVYNLLMEYVSGGTLTDAILRHDGDRLSDAAIRYYTHQIVHGLEYLHSRGIAHCDIKGRNILIGKNGAKIADFDCARLVDPSAAVGDHGATAVAIAGTPMFMAPEVARGEEQGFPADVWALGCLVIEMATGGPPWPNLTDPVSVLYRIAFSGKIPEIPDYLSNHAKDFLSKCLRRDPRERWTAKQLLTHPFLGESNSPWKQRAEFNSSSPTSILDLDLWSSLEEESEIHTSCSDSPTRRIGRLSCSGPPNWTWDENWITIRRNKDEGEEFIEDMYEDENEVYCGSATASFSNECLELEGSVWGGELMDSTARNISGSSNVSMGCTCAEHRVVELMSSLNFGRDRELLLIQSF